MRRGAKSYGNRGHTNNRQRNNRTRSAFGRGNEIIAGSTVTAGAREGRIQAHMQRNRLSAGTQVSIVLKQNQSTGQLTHGTVAELLTNSDHHPRGIKVRLTTGQVGRVQRIENSTSNVSSRHRGELSSFSAIHGGGRRSISSIASSEKPIHEGTSIPSNVDNQLSLGAYFPSTTTTTRNNTGTEDNATSTASTSIKLNEAQQNALFMPSNVIMVPSRSSTQTASSIMSTQDAVTAMVTEINKTNNSTTTSPPWTCPICTFQNYGNFNLSCEMCHTPCNEAKPTLSSSRDVSSQSITLPPMLVSEMNNQKDNKHSSITLSATTCNPWICSTCTFQNTKYELSCQMCDTLRVEKVNERDAVE